MGALLALLSSVLYGVADFAGGLLSRRAGFAVVALVGQVSGMVLMAVLAPLVGGEPTPGDLAWGALSGVGTGVGMLFLYRGMSRGAMSVVVPVSAVGGLAIPVLVGIALLDDRPGAPAMAGMALAVPALWLVSRERTGEDRRTDAGGVLDALFASVFIAVQYLALALAAPEAGLWPVLAGRVTACLAVLAPAWGPLRLAARNRRPHPLGWKPGRPRARGALVAAAGTGAVATLALVAYLLATRAQPLSVAVVLSSLYPAIPVVLGLTVLRERLNRAQVAGLVGAAVAIVLLTVE